MSHDPHDPGNPSDPTDSSGDHPEHHPHSAVEEAREIVDYTVGQVRDLGSVLSSIHSRYLIGLIVLYLATAAFGTAVVFASPFRDWYMFLAMFLVIFAFVLLYVKAHYRKRPIIKTITLTSTLLLHAFWVAVLYDRIPARRVWYGDEIILRPALPILWVPIAGLSLVAVGLVLHYAVVGRYWENR